MGFCEVIGHDNIKNQIETSIKNKRFAHAHIISGEDGIGKSIIAKYTAIKILEKEEMKSYVDIIEFGCVKGKKSIGIEEVKNIIQETNKKPYESDRKVIIVHDADKMTEAAQNAFLKTIEEPPKGIFIILLCENSQGILDTIKSRCQVYKLNRLTEEDIELFIKNKYNSLNEQELRAVVAFSDGIPGRAEKFIEDSSLRSMRDTVINMLKDICSDNVETVLKYEEFCIQNKDQWQETLTCILAYVRDVMVYKETGRKELIINIDKIDSIKEIGEMFSFNKLNGIINIVKDTRQKLQRNVNSTLVFDSMLIKMQEV